MRNGSCRTISSNDGPSLLPPPHLTTLLSLFCVATARIKQPPPQTENLDTDRRQELAQSRRAVEPLLGGVLFFGLCYVYILRRKRKEKKKENARFLSLDHLLFLVTFSTSFLSVSRGLTPRHLLRRWRVMTRPPCSFFRSEEH